MTTTVDIVVGCVSAVFSVVLIAQIYRAGKHDHGYCRRSLLVLVGLVELAGSVVIFLGQSTWWWIVVLMVTFQVEAFLITVYIYSRSRSIFWDLLTRNRIPPAVSMWCKGITSGQLFLIDL